MVLMTLVLYCGYLLLNVLLLKCLRSLLVNPVDTRVAFLPLAVYIFSKAMYSNAGLACQLECLVGLLVMHFIGHCKPPM